MKVDIGHWVCDEAWVWSLRMVPKARWEQTMLHGVKRFVKLSQPSLRLICTFWFSLILSILLLHYIIIMILISNLLYTHGSCLLDHLGTSMATSPGTSWRVASLAWAGVIQDAILGCKITVAVCLMKFRRDSVRTTVKNGMSDIRMMQQNSLR